MRDLKFRSWDGEDMLTNLDGITLEELRKLVINNGFPEDGNEQIHLVSVMQYTGLKDKNGVEIYEGDIVRINDKRTAVIEWISAAWGYRNCMSPNSSEVIGNIYENPDLLK